MNLQEAQAKWIAAVKQEESDRDLAFLVDYDYINKYKVKSLTPKLYYLLAIDGNNLISGNGQIEYEDIARFLFVIMFNKPSSKDDFELGLINDNNIEELVKDIGRYLDISYCDYPDGYSNEVENKITYTKPKSFTSGLAIIIDTIASNYGWDEDKILNMPYRRLWQYMRCIQKRNNPNIQFTNKSDDIINEFAKSLNQ